MLSDPDIISNYKKHGDPDMLAPLFDRYIHLVFGVCLKYLKNKEDAKDAAMEVMESLITKLLKHEISNFPSWLHTVSRNHCLMKIRNRKEIIINKNERIVNEQKFMESEDELHQKIEEETQLVDMERAISTLAPEQRKCIEMFYLEKKSYNEITEETGYDLKKVKSYIQNGKRNLRNYLRNEKKY